MDAGRLIQADSSFGELRGNMGWDGRAKTTPLHLTTIGRAAEPPPPATLLGMRTAYRDYTT